MTILQNYLIECPLVQKYFGRYLLQLVRASQVDTIYQGSFVNIAYHGCDSLEQRLHRIENLGLTRSIMNEVGNISAAADLDARLMDAWAEIRTIDQLLREGFEQIQKVKQSADFTAVRQDVSYAFQVTRINKSLATEASKRQEGTVDISPYGPIKEIHKRLSNPIGYLFWGRLEEKNNKFRRLQTPELRRCIVVVTSEESFQDLMQRHITCRQIRDCINEFASTGSVNFEELLWIPDNGNGAWFYIGSTKEETECWVDWKDSFPSPYTDYQPADPNQVERRWIDLDALTPY